MEVEGWAGGLIEKTIENSPKLFNKLCSLLLKLIEKLIETFRGYNGRF